MATTNHERVGKGMELLQAGLQPFLERELAEAYGEKWREKTRQTLSDTKLQVGSNAIDVAALLVLLDREWKDLFSRRLGRAHRAIVNELIAARNSWAHQETFSNDDTDRALDSVVKAYGRTFTGDDLWFPQAMEAMGQILKSYPPAESVSDYDAAQRYRMSMDDQMKPRTWLSNVFGGTVFTRSHPDPKNRVALA